MFLGNMIFDWVTSVKYLGIVFNSGFKVQIVTSYIHRKFYSLYHLLLLPFFPSHFSVSEGVWGSAAFSYSVSRCIPVTKQCDAF